MMDKELVRQRIRDHSSLIYQRDAPKHLGRHFTQERQEGPLAIAEFGGHTLTVSHEHRYAALFDEQGQKHDLYLTVSPRRRDWYRVLQADAHRYHAEMLTYAQLDPVIAEYAQDDTLRYEIDNIAMQESHKLLYRLTGNTLKWRIKRAITCLNRLLPKEVRSLAYRYYGLNATLEHLNFCWYHQELLESLPAPVATAFACYQGRSHARRKPTSPAEAITYVRSRLADNGLSDAAWKRFLAMSTKQARAIALSTHGAAVLEALADSDTHPRTATLEHLISVSYTLSDRPKLFAAYARMISQHTLKRRDLTIFLHHLRHYIAEWLANLAEPLTEEEMERDFAWYWNQAEQWHRRQERHRLNTWRRSLKEGGASAREMHQLLAQRYDFAIDEHTDGDYQLIPLKHVVDLRREAYRLALYPAPDSHTSLSGRARYYAVRTGAQSVALIELNFRPYPKPGWYLHEVRGVGGEGVTKPVMQVARRLAKAYAQARQEPHDNRVPHTAAPDNGSADMNGSFDLDGTYAPELDLPF